VALLWYLIAKFGVTKKVLDLYDSSVMERSKDFIIRIRRKRKNIFSRNLVSDTIIKNYRAGSDSNIDEILINAWRIRGTDGILRLIMELELKLCARNIELLKMSIERLESANTITPRDRRTMEQYKKMIAELAMDSMKYEKEVSKKMPNE
jgi:hypothetical protein